MKLPRDISHLPPGIASWSLQSSLHFLQAALSPGSLRREWAGEVRGVIEGLEELNGVTEGDFLAIGGNLMAFLTASRELHSDIAALTALVSGEQAQHACVALASVRGYVQDMQRRSETGGRALLAFQSAAAGIHRGFSTLGKIALSFHITAVLARIETAHFADSRQDMGNLADEVRSCSDGIRSRADQVLEAAAVFNTRVASTLAEVSRWEAIQHKQLPSLLASVEADLEIFASRQRDAAGSSSMLAAELDSVSRDLGAIAVSIQFHDITRQQVEHVIQALTGLLRDIPVGAISPSGAALVQLQAAQLKSAEGAFAESTRKIGGDLEDIAVRVSEMAAASKRILGFDQNTKDSFLADMEHRFAGILRTVAESHSLERANRAIFADLEDLSRRLRSSVAEVQTIELQLSRISINAAISASHLGLSGEPLNVVAGAMQALQTECARHSRDAERALDSIGEAILSISEEDCFVADDAAATALLADLGTGMGDLRSAGVSSTDAAAAVALVADTLCANLQEARSHSGIGQTFATAVNRCSDALDRVAAQARKSWFFPEPADGVLEGNYTMQTERDIHRAVAGGVALAPGSAIPAASEDEVEFF